MKSYFYKILFSLISVLIGIYAYLSWIYYSFLLKSDFTESFCKINETFDCLSVATSSFSSVFSIPISLFAFSFYLVFLWNLISFRFNFSSQLESLLRQLFFFSALSLVFSLLMGFISFFFLESYCILCILSYLLSVFIFIIFVLIFKNLKIKGFLKNYLKDIKSFLKNSYFPLSSYFYVLLISLLIHLSFHSVFENKELKKMNEYQLKHWELLPKENFLMKPSFKIENGDFHLIEFADFLCIHCQKAAQKIDSFLKSHKASFSFYPYPLDKCKDEFQSSCYLSKLSYCESSIFKKNELYKLFFKKQRFLSQNRQKLQIEAFLKEHKKQEADQIISCAKSEKTSKKMKKYLEFGESLGIKGTPSFFINNRKVDFFNIKLLKKLYSR